MPTEALFRRHASAAELRRLRAYLRSRVVDEATADDLLQEALLKFWRKLPTLRDEGAAQAFLGQIVRRTLLDHFRRSSRAAATAELRDVASETDLASEDADVLARLELTAGLAEYIAREVDALPGIYRDVLRAVDLQGVRQQAFAKTHGIPYSTVKSRYRRARQLLRERVDACCHVETDGHGHVVGLRPNHSPRTPACDDNPLT